MILSIDMKKDFLQIRIKDKEGESLKFHWIKNLTNNVIQFLRFTGLVF